VTRTATSNGVGTREAVAPQRGRLFKLLWPIWSYVVPNVVVFVLGVWFRVFNRTTILGRENVGYDRNVLLLSNHQTMIDSFLVGMMCFFPQSLLRPYLVPWNPAAVENYYKNALLAWFSDVHKCIPINEGRRDLKALRRMIKVFPKGVMTLFPEGTRMRGAHVGQGRVGAGMIVMSARPKVIPVAIDGMEQVLPIGAYVPRIFKHIYVSYGPPFDYSDFLDKPRSKETCQELVDQIMKQIRHQHQELRRMRGLPVPTYEDDA
jgi:1-acyl-sn-glycerol-3-phosphate acyltransferase